MARTTLDRAGVGAVKVCLGGGVIVLSFEMNL